MKAIVTCDIVKSRNYSAKQRIEVNEIIRKSYNECCDFIPDSKADKLSFNIVQGDEFQFLVNNPSLAYRFAVFFRIMVKASSPLKPTFRTGIGIGDVINIEDITYQMDGAAFHHSRSAVEALKKSNASDRMTFIVTNNQCINEELSIISYYNDFLEKNWSHKQREAIFQYNLHGNLEKAASTLDISMQALHQRIKASGWKQMSEGLDRYRQLIISRL